MYRSSFILLVSLCTAGCSWSDPQAAPRADTANAAHERPATDAKKPVTPTSLAAPHKASTSKTTSTSVSEKPAGSTGASIASKINSLFKPPKAELPVIKQTEARKDDDPVRLIGFVDVNVLQALLAFDGKIRGMEVGESYRDVEVVAIDPPTVTLQRGKERWITTLFNQPIINQSRIAGGSRGTSRVTIGQSEPASWRPGAEPSAGFTGPGVETSADGQGAFPGAANVGPEPPLSPPAPPLPGSVLPDNQ